MTNILPFRVHAQRVVARCAANLPTDDMLLPELVYFCGAHMQHIVDYYDDARRQRILRNHQREHARNRRAPA